MNPSDLRQLENYIALYGFDPHRIGKLYGNNPDSTYALCLMICSLGASGKMEEAKRELLSAAQSSDDTFICHAAAFLYQNTGQFSQAYELYSASIQLDSAETNFLSRMGLASLYWQTAQPDHALFYYEKAAEISGFSPSVVLHLVGFCILSGRRGKAQKLLKEHRIELPVLERVPYTHFSIFFAACVLFFQNKYDDALPYAIQAIKLTFNYNTMGLMMELATAKNDTSLLYGLTEDARELYNTGNIEFDAQYLQALKLTGTQTMPYWLRSKRMT